MGFDCAIFTIFVNNFGLERVLIQRILWYAAYSASLYVKNRHSTEKFILIGGTTCEFAASALWASEGVIALGHTDIKDRTKFTSIWLGLRELGQFMGLPIQTSPNC